MGKSFGLSNEDSFPQAGADPHHGSAFRDGLLNQFAKQDWNVSSLVADVTGFVDEAVEREMREQAQLLTGLAGSACLMHTRIMHGSAPNASARARTLFICVYSPDDAIALSPNPMPHAHEGMIVRGQRTGKVRSMDFALELPQLPAGASFFEQQQEALGANASE